MAKRTYGQYCGLSGALDLVGERWTLLVVRELMTGPKRYTDLADSLIGIGTSLLADRLKRLERDGIVVRGHLPPPAASTVYRLTEVGQELAQALLPLISWGLRYAVPERPGPDDVIQAHWTLLPFIQEIEPARLEGIDATYRFVVEGRTAFLRLHGGQATVLLATDSEPDATVTLSATTVVAIGSGRTTALDALGAGLVTIEGNQEALDGLVSVFAEPVGRGEPGNR